MILRFILYYYDILLESTRFHVHASVSHYRLLKRTLKLTKVIKKYIRLINKLASSNHKQSLRKHHLCVKTLKYQVSDIIPKRNITSLEPNSRVRRGHEEVHFKGHHQGCSRSPSLHFHHIRCIYNYCDARFVNTF